jgi:citrate lyase subunit beta/citryl-CoA lyase
MPVLRHHGFRVGHYGAIPGIAMRTPGQFTHPLVLRAKLEMVAACHAHGKIASHNVTTEIKDSAVVANDAQRAAGGIRATRACGASTRPDQADRQGLHAARLGSERSGHILHEAAADGARSAQHGRLHDRASYRYYWTVLQRARFAGLPLPESVAVLMNPEGTRP